MKMYKIELRNIGRKKISKTIHAKVETQEDAAEVAIEECSKYLMSNCISWHENEDGSFEVTAGSHTIGSFTISIVK